MTNIRSLTHIPIEEPYSKSALSQYQLVSFFVSLYECEYLLICALLNVAHDKLHVKEKNLP